jgi:hypothetical protein
MASAILLLLLGAAVVATVDGRQQQKHLGTWFVEHPEYAVALPGDSVFFNCKTNSDVGDEGIRWLHNGNAIPDDDPDFKTSKAGALSFKVAREREKYELQLGEYQCLSGAGNVFFASLPAVLDIARLGDFLPERNRLIEVFVDNDAVIDCKVPESNPPAFVQFYKGGDMINVENEDNVRMLNGDTLLIHDVRASDAGRYTCSAFNHITNQKKMSAAHTDLKLKEASKNEKSRPTYRPRESYPVPVGDNITIPCIASGNPKPEIYWTRMGSNEKLPSEHGCLTVTNAQEIDSGAYMCAIVNSGSGRRFLRRTTIVVQVAPVFTKTPRSTSSLNKLQPGSDFFLHCQALGTPIPFVKWAFNGLPLRKYDDSRKMVMDNGTLHVSDVRKADEGIYQCFVTNGIGQNETTVFVNVDGLVESDDFYQHPGLLEHLSLTPPSKPNVTQNSRNSALLTWSLEPHERAMPVQFFKIQFREFHRGGVRSDWRTLDEVIESRSRSFEVMGLKDEIKYRFRVVAVYANDDNLHGDLSKRFKLDTDYHTDRAPRRPPTITQARLIRQFWSLFYLLQQIFCEKSCYINTKS